MKCAEESEEPQVAQYLRTLLALGALLVQGAALLCTGRGASVAGVVGVTSLIAFMQLGAQRGRCRLTRLCSAALDMTLIGGMGMAAGALIDSRIHPFFTCPLCNANTLVTWSNGLMLLFCLAGCRVVSAIARKSATGKLCADCFCMMSMCLGMVIGHLLLRRLFASCDITTMHLAMLAGMLAGNFLGLCIQWPCYPPSLPAA
jgi:hypothetical protein